MRGTPAFNAQKRWETAILLFNYLLSMKKGQTLAIVDPKSIRMFKLTEIKKNFANGASFDYISIDDKEPL